MAKVNVYTEIKSDKREVHIGGRGQNNSSNIWVNFFSWGEKGRKEKNESGIYLNVQNIDGKVHINIDLESLRDLPENEYEVNIRR